MKTLLRQLFDVDNQLFDLSALTDLILSQPFLGSTVKVEGNESDPYAFLTVLNLKEHKDKPVIATLVKYLQEKASTSSKLAPLNELLAQHSNACIGLLLTERLINLPVEVIPPMYKMLLEEIQWATEEKEPYEFSHYLVLSKTYQEVVSALDIETGGSKKKKKQKMGADAEATSFLFHPEDEVLQRHALCFGGFEYSNGGGEGLADSRRTFQENGIKPQGHLILIEVKEYESAVAALAAFVGQN